MVAPLSFSNFLTKFTFLGRVVFACLYESMPMSLKNVWSRD